MSATGQPEPPRRRDPRTPEPPRVRPGRPADAPALARIHAESRRAAYADLLPAERVDPIPLGQRIETWHRWLTHQAAGAFVLVAEDPSSDAAIGFCCGQRASGDADADDATAELTALYVAPAAWRRGAGRALLGAALARLADAGARAATLWVLRGDEPARALYAAAGWRPDGATRDPHGPEPQERWRRELATAGA